MDSWYYRFMEAADCDSQVELADFLGIRQAFVSDAKRRNAIPTDWLDILQQRKGINLEWIRTGQGPKFTQDQR